MRNRRKLASPVPLLIGLVLIGAISSSASATTDKRKRARVRQLSRVELKQAEQRLSEMRYDTGPVDGVIDDRTRDALILFQKWEERKVSSRLTRDDFDAIMTANAPQARDAGYGHVEVDLDKQILLLTDFDGTVTKILRVSTGSNRHYNEKGLKGLAYTPRGRFRIYAKIEGWRKSPLGLLYYPNYFSDGLAIHGNPEVPNEPESHGCIRIPMSAAIEVSELLPVGTIVLIYDKDSFVSAKDWAEADRLKQETSIQ